MERARSRLALAAGDLDAAIAHAERTLDLGSRFQNRDLMSSASTTRAPPSSGREKPRRSLALIDEATVAAVSEELNPFAAGIIYCGVIAASFDVGDLGRAGNWTEAHGGASASRSAASPGSAA